MSSLKAGLKGLFAPIAIPQKNMLLSNILRIKMTPVMEVIAS